MVRTLEPRHAAYDTPVEGSWHSDANYDQVASTYRTGWGGKSATTGKMEFIKDTAFTRNVVYVKAANLWVAVDFLDAPPTVVREYRQMWHFHSDYAKASVSSSVNASGIGVVASSQANIPNLAIYQLPLLGNISGSLRYDTYHGDGCTTSNDGSLAFLPTIAAGRGCMNMGTAYGAYSHDNRVLPAVDVHAKWSGSGPQAIVSILAPTPNQVPIVSSINRVATTSGSSTYRVLLSSNKTIDIKLNTLINSEPVVTISGSGIVDAINVPRPPK